MSTPEPKFLEYFPHPAPGDALCEDKGGDFGRCSRVADHEGKHAKFGYSGLVQTTWENLECIDCGEMGSSTRWCCTCDPTATYGDCECEDCTGDESTYPECGCVC